MRVAGVEVSGTVAVPGGDICRAVRGLAHGRPVFAKWLDGAPRGLFVAEERGLDLLRVDGGPPVPEVVAAGDDGLVLAWVEPGAATRASAEAFGRALAAMHATGVPSFGARHDGFIATLPLDNTSTGDWPTFYVERRLAPYLPALDRDDRAAVEQVCAHIRDLAGPAEPPARIHGDLWSGNVLWAADGRAWLVDAAAAHGGHRETDLAMLALFGAPHLDVVLASYDEARPLAPGWEARVSLHQLHPLLVHAALFGGGYGARAARAATVALRAR